MGRAAAVPLGGAVLAALVTGLSPPVAGSHGDPARAATRGWVRVNQQGYLPGEPQQARLMTTAPVSGTRYRVTDSSGTVVQRGRVPSRSAGSWGRRIRAVYRLDLGALHRPGRYRVSTTGGVSTRSPWFRVSSADAVFGSILDAGVAFDRNQRDGAAVVPGPLQRSPSHLNDGRASV